MCVLTIALFRGLQMLADLPMLHSISDRIFQQLMAKQKGIKPSWDAHTTSRFSPGFFLNRFCSVNVFYRFFCEPLAVCHLHMALFSLLLISLNKTFARFPDGN